MQHTPRQITHFPELTLRNPKSFPHEIQDSNEETTTLYSHQEQRTMHAHHVSTLHCFIKSQNTLKITFLWLLRGLIFRQNTPKYFIKLVFFKNVEKASLNIFFKFCYVWTANIDVSLIMLYWWKWQA